MTLSVLALGTLGSIQRTVSSIRNKGEGFLKIGKGYKGRQISERTTSRDVFLLSLPLFIELFMQIMVGNVNQIMLAPQGNEAADAVGNALQILNIITIALSAMGTACTVLVTRVIGGNTRHNKKEISEITSVALLINIILSIIITIGLFTLWPQFFIWLHIEPKVYPIASSFLLVVGATSVIQGAFFALTALLRSFARMRDVIKTSIIMNAVNIGACFLFINGLGLIPSFGVQGAAFANVIARVVGFILIGLMLYKHTDVRPTLTLLRPFPFKAFKNMLCVGIPSSGEQMNYDLAQIVILSFINILGASVVTVKIYCSLLGSIAYLYSIALSQATQIVLGYLFGAGKLNMVRRRVWMADLIACALTTLVSLIIYLNFSTLIGFFTPDTTVHELGHQIMLIEMLLGVGRSLNIVMVRALIALGDVRTPVSVNIAFSWLIAVGGGWFLGIGWGWGLIGMWIAMCIDEWLRAGFLILVFARGGWQKRLNKQKANTFKDLKPSSGIEDTPTLSEA